MVVVSAEADVATLAEKLEELDISSKSQAQKYVEENGHWGCGHCSQVFGTPKKLRRHLRKVPKHRYGQARALADKQRFNRLMGLREDEDFRPLEGYPPEAMSPALKKEFYRLIGLQVQLVAVHR
mmetsp:Transcript_12674/g.32420  ORF Transcript_12674/g.32420 Transcript_12674/m.32420 type:complete len:124 (-) Transcript_12674:284-655(-)|eukprot:CAMPEP_0182916060 /NCGR_PEP_ID=MMETSP0105_2-20130417/721_1 /TAXON_ID=81532 ORGANISM="Acanthoeca-like sp., Strain 10tr" /NCGR_SAMPLE_ID=MMETSP0105_2 /ASSEMBLY_ACC=CAM_ASM_000205 /LENGTH=123 /DNA_ID=CAMNT_0025052985 /DNA_START=374 /DNA_END=745 /DNA_ORIENTATION=-